MGEFRADVAVVGGGIAGCSAALHLAQRGFGVGSPTTAWIFSAASGLSVQSGYPPVVLTVGVLLAVLITGQVAGDGRSDWLKGAQLLAVYLVLGLTFFFMPAASASP